MCVQCAMTKDLSEFYKHPNMSDGRSSKCSACYKKAVMANREKRSKHYAAYEKRRAKGQYVKGTRLEKMQHREIKEHRQEYGVIMRQVLNFRREHPTLRVNDCIQIMSNDNTDLIREAWQMSLEYLPEKKSIPT